MVEGGCLMGDVTPITAAASRGRNTFSLLRWDWAAALARTDGLSPIARLVGYVLVTQFAHHETADCHPGWVVLAEAVCSSERTVRRAVVELEDAGFLSRGPGGHSGAKVAILFRFEHKPLVPASGADDAGKVVRNGHQKAVKSGHQKVANPDHQSGGERWPVLSRKVASSDNPPTPPYKDKPNYNQSGGDHIDLWAGKVLAREFIPQSAIRADMAREMLRRRLLTEADLRTAGVDW